MRSRKTSPKKREVDGVRKEKERLTAAEADLLRIKDKKDKFLCFEGVFGIKQEMSTGIMK